MTTPTPTPPRTLARTLGVVRTLVTVAVAIVGIGGFLAWMGGAFHAKVPPGVVTVERPKLGDRTVVTADRTSTPETVTAVGSVQPWRKTDVASQLLASIREVTARPGDRVKAGQVLVTLDDRELVAQQREAVASLAAADADLVTRRAEYQRTKTSFDRGGVSAEELNKTEGAFRVAETQIRRAKETIGRIEVLLTYTQIAVSTDGLVSERNAEPGDLATPGKPILGVYDPNDLELQVSVPESLSVGLGVGQSLDVRIDALNLATAARIREVVPQAQQTSRSVLVKLGMPQSVSNPILPGMFGRALIPAGRAERVWIPEAAVQKHGQLDLVDVVGEDGTLARRFIRVGREAGGKVEILSGLAAGERVALPAK